MPSQCAADSVRRCVSHRGKSDLRIFENFVYCIQLNLPDYRNKGVMTQSRRIRRFRRYYGKHAYRPPTRLLKWRAGIYFNQITKCVPVHAQTDILEIACNYGYLTDLLRTRSESVIGIDINRSIVEQSEKDYLKVMDACHLEFPDHAFDLVVAAHIIEHIQDTSRFLNEVTRVLRPGGHAVLIYPWEPVRGYTILPEVLTRDLSLREARKIHLHAFTPRKIRKCLQAPLIHQSWRVFFVPQPNFISVIRKNDAKQGHGVSCRS